MPACYTCKSRNNRIGTFSAYCTECQPEPRRMNLGSSFKTAGCAYCGEVFTTDRNFDRHQRGGLCLNPASVGLELKDNGRWGAPGR